LGTFLDNVSVRCNPLVQGCGNNVIEQGETCELPDTTNNQNCSQSTAQCATGNKTQTRDAFGNCDGACGCISDNFSEPVCVKDSCNAVCAVDADCNDQNENTTDTCNLTTCSCQNISHTCGNGILQEGEQCDNGTQNGQACSPACENSCSYCSAQCTIVALQGETCGRGGDGGGGGGGGHLIVCGDGIREWEEQCDDGNKIDGDGCSSICRTEQVLGETTEEEGEILAESTTRLPETGGNPLWISVVGLIAAFASGISIKKLAFSRI
jgi:cysteine-rich repeat protein